MGIITPEFKKRARKYAIIGGIGAVLTSPATIPLAYNYGTLETEKFTVTRVFEKTLAEDTGRVDQNGDPVMVSRDEKRLQVTLENGCTETFRVEDSNFHLQWKSSNLHGNFEEGETYQATHYGWRIGMLSWMENIISAKHLPDQGPYKKTGCGM